MHIDRNTKRQERLQQVYCTIEHNSFTLVDCTYTVVKIYKTFFN